MEGQHVGYALNNPYSDNFAPRHRKRPERSRKRQGARYASVVLVAAAVATAAFLAASGASAAPSARLRLSARVLAAAAQDRAVARRLALPQFRASVPPAPPLRLRAYDYAVSHMSGCPYVWGGNGPCGAGYDCSGLVQHAYLAFRVWLPRTVEEMVTSGKLVRIPDQDARKGDIAVWFSGGVGVHAELAAYLDKEVFGETDAGAASGYSQVWDDPVYYRVR